MFRTPLPSLQMNAEPFRKLSILRHTVWAVMILASAIALSPTASAQGQSGAVACPKDPNAASITDGYDTDGDDYCSIASGGTDCNDTAGSGVGNGASINPGAPETCNDVGIDNDCDGIGAVSGNAEDVPFALHQDADDDGYGNPAVFFGYGCPVELNFGSGPTWYINNKTDCNDSRADAYPGGTEVCDGYDNDCDNYIDEGVTTPFYRDSDGDTYGNASIVANACSQPDGYASNTGDCNDSASYAWTGRAEICDTYDNDCDTYIDEGVTTRYYRDVDGDSYGVQGTFVDRCSVQDGYTDRYGDCNDTYGSGTSTYPGAPELCATSTVDNNCNNDSYDIDTYASDKVDYFRDADLDTYTTSQTSKFCPGTTNSGWRATANPTDCNDANAAINPGAVEICDGYDNNCVGGIDDGLTTSPYYIDTDGDGYGAGTAVQGCVAPPGYVAFAGDCNDNQASIRPGATEVCDDIDNNCNGTVDEGLKNRYYRDADGDTYGSTTVFTDACSRPDGYVTNQGDCNDNPAAGGTFAWTGRAETCDTYDNDCDSLIDDADPTVSGQSLYYPDADSDGYGSRTASGTLYCFAAAGRVTDNTDCYDTYGSGAAINPGAQEVCDGGVDNDCDNYADDNDPSTSSASKTDFYADSDGDTYGSGTAVRACVQPANHVTRAGDCNDSYSYISPAGTEVCDAYSPVRDEDCDGVANDLDTGGAGGKTTFYRDVDGDSYGSPTNTMQRCSAGDGYVGVAGDCNDALVGGSAFNPGAQEICDGYDNDCDTYTDDADPSVTGRPTWYRDGDNDTYGDPAVSRLSCTQPDGYVSNSADGCPTVQSLQAPVTWYRDGDSDGYGDPAVAASSCTQPDAYVSNSGDGCPAVTQLQAPLTFYRDTDRDGFGSTTVQVCALTAPDGYSSTGGDCNDTYGSGASINPNATEVCDPNNVDEDCDTYADNYDSSAEESTKSRYYFDGDGDSWGIGKAVFRCDAADGYSSAINGDCNDQRADVYPGAQEVCDAYNVDEDCDDLADNADPSALAGSRTTFYRDADNDGYGTSSNTRSRCDAEAGYVARDGDCNDGNQNISPGRPEVCDLYNTDEDCDGYADNADPGITPDILQSTGSAFYRDADGDGYAVSDVYYFCDQPSGFLGSPGNDCNDAVGGVNPGATEIIDNSRDDNCDGYELCYRDVDNDGFLTNAAGGPATTSSADLDCTDAYEGTSTDARTDCNDTNAAINTSAAEACDGGIDNDCDGYADDADTGGATGKSAFYRDSDADTYGDTYTTMQRCAAGDSYIAASGDCNDADRYINPSAQEVCDASNVDEDATGSPTTTTPAHRTPRAATSSPTAMATALAQGCRSAGATGLRALRRSLATAMMRMPTSIPSARRSATPRTSTRTATDTPTTPIRQAPRASSRITQTRTSTATARSAAPAPTTATRLRAHRCRATTAMTPTAAAPRSTRVRRKPAPTLAPTTTAMPTTTRRRSSQPARPTSSTTTPTPTATDTGQAPRLAPATRPRITWPRPATATRA